MILFLRSGRRVTAHRCAREKPEPAQRTRFAVPVRPVVAGEITRFSGASICHDILTLQMGFPVFTGVLQQVHDSTRTAFTI